MEMTRSKYVEIVNAAQAYADAIAPDDNEKNMPLFVKALMDGIHAVDPDMAQRIKKLAMEKQDGLDRTGL